MKVSILARRHKLIVAPTVVPIVVPSATKTLSSSASTSSAPGRTSMKRLVFLAELAQLGYTVRNIELWSDRILDHYDELLTTLREMRGAEVEYVPLFQGFPDRCPDETEYQAHRLLSWFVGLDDIAEEQGYQLLDGDERSCLNPAFNSDDFGALPVSQMQTQSLYEAGVQRQARREGDRVVEWIALDLVTPEQADAQLQTWVQQTLYSRSSLKASIRTELAWLLRYFSLDHRPVSIDPAQITFKETLTFVTEFYWQQGLYDNAADLLKTPTDILRLCASLTDGDVSLTAPITFPKFSRPQRKVLLRVLEQCHNLPEDLLAYQGLWLALGRYLHPAEYQRQFPKVAAAFDQLRNGKIRTFNSKLEAALGALDLRLAVALLQSRPGLFARRLHQLLEMVEAQADPDGKDPQAPSIQWLLAAFSQIAAQVPLKNLLVLARYFDTIYGQCLRVTINKSGRIWFETNNPERTSEAVNQQAALGVQRAIAQNIQLHKPTWQTEKIWIDPQLKQYVLPLSDRQASEGTLPLARGSRVSLKGHSVLRLFVYWKEAECRTDLDLSVQMLGEDFSALGHVSYTSLADTGIQHSGDIQSAPHGAAEFIDIQLDRLNPEWRYIAMQVYRYSGENFNEMTCHCGWMEREQASTEHKTFDPKTVRSKVDLEGTAAFAMPLIVDLKRQEIIYTDLFIAGRSTLNCVERAGHRAKLICAQVAKFHETKPTFWDLAIAHLQARGGNPVESPAEATITFGLEDCTYNVYDTARVLSELL